VDVRLDAACGEPEEGLAEVPVHDDDAPGRDAELETAIAVDDARADPRHDDLLGRARFVIERANGRPTVCQRGRGQKERAERDCAGDDDLSATSVPARGLPEW
jgi:hypothetical protein